MRRPPPPPQGERNMTINSVSMVAFSRGATGGNVNLSYGYPAPSPAPAYLNNPPTGANPITPSYPYSGGATAAALPEKNTLPPDTAYPPQQPPMQAAGMAIELMEKPPPYTAN